MGSKSRNKICLKEFKFSEIPVGKKFFFKRVLTKKDVKDFAYLTGDYNPLHTDEEFAKCTAFKGTISHGMLAASLFSTLIGMHCPGKYSLILNQEIKYIKPVKPESKIKICGEVVQKVDAIKVLIIKTLVLGKKNEVLVEGISKVKMTR